MTEPATDPLSKLQRVITKPLPVFADQSLSMPSFVHRMKCRAGTSADGSTSNLRCSCHSTVRQLHSGTAIVILEEKESSWLVRVQDAAPFWIEPVTLRSQRQKIAPPLPQSMVPSGKRPSRSPPDYVAIECFLGEYEGKLPCKLPYKRRRTEPSGGEIVFIRSEMRRQVHRQMRLFALVRNFDGEPCAMLIAPNLSVDRALDAGYAEQELIVLMRGEKSATPGQFLMPAFPLPDGTENPGWL